MLFFLVQVRLIVQATYCGIEGDILFPVLEEIDMSFDTKSFHYITYFHYVIHYIMYIKQSTTANKFSIIRSLLIWLIDIFDQALRIQYSDFNRTSNAQLFMLWAVKEESMFLIYIKYYVTIYNTSINSNKYKYYPS